MMDKYKSYKSSGADWIGDIPEQWDVSKLKWHLKRIEPRNPGGVQVLSLYREHGIVPKDSRNDNHNVTSEDTSNYKYVEPGNFVVNKMKAWQGSVAVSEYEGIVSPAYYVYHFTDDCFERKYFHYLMRGCYKEEFMRLSGGIRIGQWDLPGDALNNVLVIVPPKHEQKYIVEYLDGKVSEIDRLIDETNVSIEDYKKLKASVIFEKVTKGINSKSRLVDSGIEWFGDIPENWDVCKTLFVLDMPITDGPHTTPTLYDEGVPFVSAEAVSCGNGSIDFSHIRGYISEEFYEECCQKYIPKINDIYMIKSGATTGKVSVVETDKKFTIWSPLAVFRSNEDRMYYRYLFYFLQSDAYQKQVQLGWTYGTQQNIGMRTLEKLKVCVPPLSEQRDIAEYLDQKCAVLDYLISEKESLVEDLDKYKKSLIFDVVTGKRKVV